MGDPLHPALRAVSDAVLAVAAQRSVDDVLQGLVERARELAGARYAALGIPDGAGGFRRFLVAGMAPDLIARLGPLPRTHGLLAAMLETTQPYRTADLHRHPRFRGWWPSGHPDMRSFLGVPIVGADGVIGAFYLTHKEAAPAFDEADEALIGLLAAHAAIAIANARLYERTSELSILAERNRLARELHDAVVQKLFGVVLTAEAAETLAQRGQDPREHLSRVRRLAAEALEELRVLIGELRPPDLGADGLAGTLAKHVDVSRRLHEDVTIALHADAGATTGEPASDREVLRVAQEALHNALRHSGAGFVAVTVRARPGGGVALEVADDGTGFDPADPALRTTRLGLTSMEERARRLGGSLAIASGAGGTTVRLEARGG